jgi:uncharacterized lipoprotein YmbA
MPRLVRPVLVLGLLAAVGSSGCALRQTTSAKTYVLDPLPAASGAAPSARPTGVVGVLKVIVPGWVDRPQITGRTATGEVATDEYARWGEPIERGMQRVLAENLAILVPDLRFITAPFPPGDEPRLRIEVIVSEVARQADGSVLLESRWAVLGPRAGTLVQSRSRQRTIPSVPGASGSVLGMNETLAGLSREIAEALKNLPQPGQ